MIKFQHLISFFRKDSLIRDIDEKLTKENPFLAKSATEKITDLLDQHGKWYTILAITLVLFFVPGLIEVPILNFIHIKDESVLGLINNRTTDIITMLGIVFVIIGFIIQYLAIQAGYTYKHLFKHLSFLPIIYTSLSLIICFVILSTFQDWLPIRYQAKTLLVGTYLMFIVIFLIGFLFSQLLKFTDKEKVFSLVEKEYLLWFKQSLIREISKCIIPLTPIGTHVKSEKPDVMINKVMNILNKIFMSIHLDRCVVSVQGNNKYINLEDQIYSKLENCISENNSKQAGDYLGILLKTFSLDLSYNVEDFVSPERIKEGKNVTIPIMKLRDLILKVIEADARKTFFEVDGFCHSILEACIVNNNIAVFKSFLDLVLDYYAFSSTLKYKYNFARFDQIYSEYSSQRINEVLPMWHISDIGETKIKDTKNLNEFHLAVFEAFSILLYSQIKCKDLKSFKYTMNKLGMISPILENKDEFFRQIISSGCLSDENKLELQNNLTVYNYKYHCVLGIKYWLYYLYEKQVYTETELLDFINVFNQDEVPYLFEIEIIYNILNSPSSSYLNWKNWEYRDYEEGKAYIAPSVFDWMIKGYFVDIIKNSKIDQLTNNMNAKCREALIPTNDLFQNIIFLEFFNKVTSSSIWSNYLQLDDKKNELKGIKENLNIIRKNIEIYISSQNFLDIMDVEKVNKAISLIRSNWKQRNILINIFESNGKKNTSTIAFDWVNKSIKSNKIFPKKQFIPNLNYSLNNFEEFGKQVRINEEFTFYEKILDSKDAINYTNLPDALNKSIEKLSSNNKKASIIFIHWEMEYNQRRLLGLDKLDLNDDISIHLVQNRKMKDKFIIADFGQAFTMFCKENLSGSDNILRVEYNEIPDEEIKEMIKNEPGKYKMIGEQTLTEDDSIAYVKSFIKFECILEEYFEIDDINAFEIGIIK